VSVRAYRWLLFVTMEEHVDSESDTAGDVCVQKLLRIEYI